jgi:hypothetical protein
MSPVAGCEDVDSRLDRAGKDEVVVWIAADCVDLRRLLGAGGGEAHEQAAGRRAGGRR